jgi:hypothetical protein
MLKRRIASLAVVALATTGAGLVYSSPVAVAKKCNPNINGEINSGHGEQGNDDKPCPTEAPAPAAAPAAGPAEAPAAAPAEAPAPAPARPAAAAARPVTAQPRTTG